MRCVLCNTAAAAAAVAAAAGKSTLMGRLLSELGQVSQKEVHKNQRESAQAGKVRPTQQQQDSEVVNKDRSPAQQHKKGAWDVEC
jgi:hypothetical protein